MCSYRINSHYTQSELISQCCLLIPRTKLTPSESRAFCCRSIGIRWMNVECEAAGRGSRRGAEVTCNRIWFLSGHRIGSPGSSCVQLVESNQTARNKWLLVIYSVLRGGGGDGGMSGWVREEELRYRWKGMTERRCEWVGEWRCIIEKRHQKRSDRSVRKIIIFFSKVEM